MHIDQKPIIFSRPVHYNGTSGDAKLNLRQAVRQAHGPERLDLNSSTSLKAEGLTALRLVEFITGLANHQFGKTIIGSKDCNNIGSWKPMGCKRKAMGVNNIPEIKE